MQTGYIFERSALIEFLSEVSSPDHVNRLEAAKKEAGGNFVDHVIKNQFSFIAT